MPPGPGLTPEGFPMIAASKQVAWGFWLRWVAATTVGFALGSAVVGRAQAGVEALLRIPVLSVISANLRDWSYTALFVAEMTLPGFLQWLILRRWCSRAGWWVLASGVGLLL